MGRTIQKAAGREVPVKEKEFPIQDEECWKKRLSNSSVKVANVRGNWSATCSSGIMREVNVKAMILCLFSFINENSTLASAGLISVGFCPSKSK